MMMNAGTALMHSGSRRSLPAIGMAMGGRALISKVNSPTHFFGVPHRLAHRIRHYMLTAGFSTPGKTMWIVGINAIR